MDLMRARVTLRERNLLDVFDLAIRFCIVHAGAYAKISVFVLVPSFAVSLAAAQLGGWWMGWTVAVVVSAFATTPYVALASRLVFADAVGTREALGIALRAVPALLLIRFLQLLALAASMFLAFMPWLWLGTILLFVAEVVVLEQSSIGATFGRAQRIASAHFGSVAGTMLAMLIVPVAAAMIADMAGREVLQTVLEIRPPPSIFREGGSWLALAGFWIVVPIMTTARFFAYLDVRTRTEGWDIQTRFAAIAARASEDSEEGRARRAA
jgi:hypothetical protein